jgi:hypothetical protein
MNLRNIATRASVLAVAAGAGLALTMGATSTDDVAYAKRSCAREIYLTKYWDKKAALGDMFLFSSSTVAHYRHVAQQHFTWAVEVC